MMAETPDPDAFCWRDYRRAEARRRPWEALWRDCAAHALPLAARTGRSIAMAASAPPGASTTPPPPTLPSSLPPACSPNSPRPSSAGSASSRGQEAAPDSAGHAGHGRRGRAGPSRPLRLRGRDAPGAARPGGAGHGLPAVRGKRAGRGLRLPLHRRAAAPRSVLEEGPEGRLDRVWRRREFGPAAAPRPLPPRARPFRRRAVRRRGERCAGARRLCRRFDESPRYARRRLPLSGRAGGRRRQGGADPGRGPLRGLALHLLPLAEGAGRGLWALAGDEGAARHQDRRQGGGAHPEERLHRRDRHLAGRR